MIKLKGFWPVVAIDVAVLISWFTYGYIHIDEVTIALLFPALLMATYALLPSLVLKRKTLALRRDKTVMAAAIAGAVFVLFTLEPLIVSGGKVHSSSLPYFLYGLTYVLAYALFIQTLLFNLNTKKLIVKHRKASFNLPFALFAVMLISPGQLETLPQYSTSALLSFTMYFISNFLFFYLLFIAYLKSRFNNATGLVLTAIMEIPGTFAITVRANPVLEYSWELLSYGVALVLFELLTHENHISRVFFTTKRIPFRAKRLRAAIATASAFALIIVLIFAVLPAMMGTPHPLYSDPTGSMYPRIHPGSLLIVRGISPQSVKVGDIIVFNAPWEKGLTVAHMVIGMFVQNGTLYFITKGIANPVKDPSPVPAVNVLGIVIYAIPYLGYLFIYSALSLSVALILISGALFWRFE